MYLNDVLTLVYLKEIDDDMGYNKKVFEDSKITFKIDRQPISSELAKKAYGLVDSSATYLCFSQKKGLKTGDYVCLQGEYYQVLLVHNWEYHLEFILGSFKGNI